MRELDEETLRNRLKLKRNSLLNEFRRSPSKTYMAIEIRLIDDQIATLTDFLAAQRTKSPEPMDTNRHRTAAPALSRRSR
jgi:hypothetical protein